MSKHTPDSSSIQLELPFEEWRDIPGWEGHYQASNAGRIKNLRPNGVFNPRIIPQHGEPLGYMRVHLSELPLRHKIIRVHQLVMLAFVGLCPDGYMVNHRNGDKTDNRLDNLEYATPSDNIKHRDEVLGLSNKGERNGRSKLTEQDVHRIRQLLKSGGIVSEVAREYGVNVSTIRDIGNGKSWRHLV